VPWPEACRLYDLHSAMRAGVEGDRRKPGEGRRAADEAKSSGLRLAPSPGALSSDGISRRARQPSSRMDKREREHRLRGSRMLPSEGSSEGQMRFVGIDVGAERHWVGVVGEREEVILKSTPFSEDAPGYTKLFELLGTPVETMVAMEATGHYWKNLFAALVARGFSVALLNPLRTRRFAEEDLERTKTDSIDALGIARFASQKRPAAARLGDADLEELRELVGLRDRLQQDFGDRVRQLHRLVDLGFPEFTRYVKDLATERATSILSEYPTAEAFRGVSLKRLARLRYDGQHRVGEELARELLAAAQSSVGHHHGHPYRIQVRFICQDLGILRQRLGEVDRDIEKKIDAHQLGRLLTTIDGIGTQTAAKILARIGDPAELRSSAALASFVGVVPALRQSGKKQNQRAPLTPHGDANLRAALWMPTLAAVRRNAWLRSHYQRLRARGKLPKVALVACMRKLLTAVYSVAKNRRPFVPQLIAVEVPA
jgi:transposase